MEAAMTIPAVTALIDTYNHERFIEEAIVSALEQDFPSADVEILVVDDGSTDRTPEIVRKFEPRVRLIRKPNGGQASAFNTGIPQARGEIIAFLDGDDRWAKKKLQIVTDTMAAHPDIGIVGHGYYEDFTSGEEGKVICPEGIYRLHLRDAQAAALFIQLKGFLGTSKLAIRKPILDRVLPIPIELKIEADEYMFTAAVAVSDALILT
ncbi:MAG: glycosyltransferase family 2 protein, partial [Candidatus Acidiferrales bacterium]